MATRKLPQNLDAEMSVLGICFLNEYALDKVCEDLIPEMFLFVIYIRKKLQLILQL